MGPSEKDEFAHLYSRVLLDLQTTSDLRSHDSYLGGGFKYFFFSPLLGEMIQFH